MLKKLVAAEGISEAVNFIAWLPKDEVKNVYHSASVFLFPSHEGAGMVVPEAMSHGLPVVCLENYGPGEMVHIASKLPVAHGKYERTVSELADRLTKLFDEPDFMAIEKRLTEIRYNELFTWDVRGEMLKEVYQTVLTK